MTPRFIHLHLHTEYSLVDGLVKIKPLMRELAAKGMPAVAITDQNNLFAMVKFYRAALAAGIKPLIGADLWIQNSLPGKSPHHLVLLCQNKIGYQNLTQLISRAYLEGQHLGRPTISKDWLRSSSDGLIALSGAENADIGQALLSNQPQLAQQLLTDWLSIFPERFYIELQRVGREYEQVYITEAVKLAIQFDVPVVATNDVRFIETTDFDAHEARVCIHGGWTLNDERRPRSYSPQQYLRSAEEMIDLFADIPQAIANTVEIAKRCNVELSLGQCFLPNFSVPAGLTVDDFFQQEAVGGLEKRLLDQCSSHPETIAKHRQAYDERLHMEVSVIRKMGFTGYFLIVADFIRWAKQQQIFVGPGRGSGAGSLVAYALGITDLDPLAQDLLFERFLNPERVSMADFDIDFCMEGRDRVIEYVAEKYGKDSVAQIITYGTMAARAVVRDVGRILGHPYGFVDKIAKLIPFELGMTLQKALNDEALLNLRYQQEAEVSNLIDLAMKLEGVPRNVGKHAGGVVIAPSVLTDFAPLYCEPGGSNRVTQFDKDDVEAVGLVKFDFLGLRTLTIMDWALRAINAKRQQQGESVIDINRLPLDDQPTYALLRSSMTTAVFQLESRGIKELIRRLQPECFDDIVPLMALFRPGPLQSGMVEDFLNRRHGKAKVVYPHPSLAPILSPTYGVILYQEQVMQIAQVLSGYTLGGADLLRRAMGKKKLEEMAKQRAVFVNGAESRGVEASIANHIFDLIEKFAGYGFNKSHSAAYALLSYQTAWLKAHYPAEFMAAVLSSDMDHTDKVVKFLEDCHQFKLRVIAPDINRSHYHFAVASDGAILYGLGAIKGVGSAAVEDILRNRKEKGNFLNLFEFCQRVGARKVNRKVLEALIRSGAFDGFKIERAILLASIDKAIKAAEQEERTKSAGQADLFDDLLVDAAVKQPHYVVAAPWSDEERLSGEKETLGWYVSGHPIARYEAELTEFISSSIAALKPNRDKVVKVAGFITHIRTLQTKSGGRIAFITVQDRTGRIDAGLFGKTFEQYRQFLVKDQLVIIEGEVGIDEFNDEYKLNVNCMYDLAVAREKFADHLSLQINPATIQSDFVSNLKQALSRFQGGQLPVFITYEHTLATARLALGNNWRIKPQQDLLDELRRFLGEEQVQLLYNKIPRLHCVSAPPFPKGDCS